MWINFKLSNFELDFDIGSLPSSVQSCNCQCRTRNFSNMKTFENMRKKYTWKNKQQPKHFMQKQLLVLLWIDSCASTKAHTLTRQVHLKVQHRQVHREIDRLEVSWNRLNHFNDKLTASLGPNEKQTDYGFCKVNKLTWDILEKSKREQSLQS